MAHSLTTIGRHLECAIEPELIDELELAERKQSGRFRQSCSLCARAKIKGQIELKIEENTFLGKLVTPFRIWYL